LRKKNEDRFLIKRRDTEDDDDPKEISPNNIIKIKNSLKIDNNISSAKSEEIPSNSTPNNSNYMENMVKGLTSFRTVLF
jgi:hypothetical protein